MTMLEAHHRKLHRHKTVVRGSVVRGLGDGWGGPHVEWNLSCQEPGQPQVQTANWGCFEDLLTLSGQNKKGHMNWMCSVTQLLGSSKLHVTTSPEGQPTFVQRFSVNRPEGCPALVHACGVNNNPRGEWTLPTPLISCLSLLVFLMKQGQSQGKPLEAVAGL